MRKRVSGCASRSALPSGRTSDRGWADGVKTRGSRSTDHFPRESLTELRDQGGHPRRPLVAMALLVGGCVRFPHPVPRHGRRGLHVKLEAQGAPQAEGLVWVELGGNQMDRTGGEVERVAVPVEGF